MHRADNDVPSTYTVPASPVTNSGKFQAISVSGHINAGIFFILPNIFGYLAIYAPQCKCISRKIVREEHTLTKATFMEPYDGELSTFPVKTEILVQWGDMDAAQHVNNLHYLKWFETARIDYFARLGQDVVFNDDKPGFILAKQDIKYLFPLTHPDRIIAAVRVTDMSKDRFTMHCRVYSQRHQCLAAIMNGVIVTFDYKTQEKAPVPPAMRQLIEQLEGHTIPEPYQ